MASLRSSLTVIPLALLLVAVPALAAEWPDLASPGAVQGGGENDAALILAVEDYLLVADVPGANQNARDWYLHFTKSMKVPADRVRLLRDTEVTRESILSAAKEAARTAKAGGTLWVVFIGHGAPAADGKDGVLVGVDAQQTAESLYARSVGQRELLDLLAKGSQARTVAVVDACFSGSTGTGALVAGLQPLLPVVAGAKLDARAVVLSAGAGNQFAGPLPGVARPAFSYLILGALRGWGDADSDSKVTATEAVTYARSTIGMVVKGRAQTPEVAFGDGKVVLAGGAKEKGPDLVAFVLEHRPNEEKAAPEVKKAGPAVKGNSIIAVVGDLTVDVKPREGVRLEVTDPTGKTFAAAAPYKNDAAAIGRWRVVAKAEGYADETQEFEVPPDETTVAKLSLKRLGGLKVSGTPVGAAVKVAGPGFAPPESGLPWEATGLRSGVYRVEVSRAGYESFARDITVEPGGTAEVKVDLQKTSSCPAGMAYVAGGGFVPRRKKATATVGAFCLDQTEVTVAAYSACVTKGRCSRTGLSCDSQHANWGRADRKDHPVNCVDWNQALAYCRAIGKRLPAEEEWAWVVRGGERATAHPWGDGAPSGKLCWNGDWADPKITSSMEWNEPQGGIATCTVGSHPADAAPGGVLDLAGNVSEWLDTPYPNHPAGPSMLAAGGSRFVSGRLMSSPEFAGAMGVDAHRYYVGFRCAKTP